MSATAAVLAALECALLVFPMGIALTFRMSAEHSRGERLILAALVGYVVSAAAYHFSYWFGAPWIFAVLQAGAIVAALRVSRAFPTALGTRSIRWIAPLALFFWIAVLFVWTHGTAAFTPMAGGRLRYDHSVDHSVHLALYWEMLRGLPPSQLPTAAGMAFPSYHTLAFMPGVLLVKWGGLNLTTVYHIVSPALRLSLIAGAAYLAVRLKTTDRHLALAAIPALLAIGPWCEVALGERVVAGPSPYYFFVRNESGGGAIVAWAAVACLLLLYERRPLASTLWLSAAIAGLAFAFKAQMFVLFGGAYFLTLVFLFARTRERHVAEAFAIGVGMFAWAFVTSRGHGPLGTLHFTPGLFADLYIYPSLASDPWRWVRESVLGFLRAVPGDAGFILATPLAIWRIATFSPAAPFAIARTLRGRGSSAPADLMFALLFAVSLPLGYFFSAVSIDRDVSPFEFLQAAHGLAFWGAIANVIALGRIVPGRGRIVLASTLAVSAAALGSLLQTPRYIPPREAIVLRPAEICALSYLRTETPFDAVTIGWRDDLGDGQRPKRMNHQAVLGGLAGRRSVLEYYGAPVDPLSNRERAVRRLFNTTDAAVGEEFLRRYHVDYVIEFPGRPLRFTSPHLERVFSHDDVRVLKFEGARVSPKPVMRPPEPWAESSDLTCPQAEVR